MAFTIRPGERADAESIARFQCLMALETENKTLDMATVLPAVKAVFTDRSKGFYLVTEIDGKVIGSLMVTYEWSDWRNCNMWYIQSLYVDADFRGQGAFRGLYRRVLELARESNAMFVRLYVEVDNERAQKTYEKLGMKRMPYYLYDVKV